MDGKARHLRELRDHHSPLSSGAISKASHRAERSKERAMEILVRASQESFGLPDELFDCAEFFPAIAETCLILDCSQFVGADRYARIGVPSIFRAAVAPTHPPSRVADAGANHAYGRRRYAVAQRE